MGVGLSLPAPISEEEAKLMRDFVNAHFKAHVKIVVTDPDGKPTNTIEGDVTDGFTSDFVNLFFGMLFYPLYQSQGGVPVVDVAKNTIYLWSPGTYATPFLGLCVTNCPGTSGVIYSLKMPGIWLYKSPFSPYAYVWNNYNNLITNITYYSPSPSPSVGNFPSVSYGGTTQFSITQQMTNTSGSTLTVSSFAAVGALYSIVNGALNTPPVFIGFLYFDLAALGQSPITWSPAAGMTVTVTIQMVT